MTPKQKEALDVLAEMQELNGYTPTIRELGELLGKSRTAAHALVEALTRQGYIERVYGSTRSMKIVKRP